MWFYLFINVACKDGTYGNNCVHNCSGNCLNDSPCNKQTGHCDTGCKPGFTNTLCIKRELNVHTRKCVLGILENFDAPFLTWYFFYQAECY